MHADLLTTGQVARLCGVTPDAVLKWIRKGELPASRTAGGHWRISRETLRQRGLCAKGTRSLMAERCWEYFGRLDAPAEACKDCIVFRAKAERCFEVANIGASIGHKKRFCASDCKTCPFYQTRMGLAVSILVVTANDALIASLSKEPILRKANVRTAKSGYESASVISTFRPSLIILDGSLPEVREGRLVEVLLHDSQLPGARLAVFGAQAAFARRRHHRLEVVPPPLTVQKIQRLAEALFDTNGP